MPISDWLISFPHTIVTLPLMRRLSRQLKYILMLWFYLSKRSQRKLYPCHIRKSSRRSLGNITGIFEEVKASKHLNISRGDRSSDCCIFWTRVDKHSFCKTKKIKELNKYVCVCIYITSIAAQKTSFLNWYLMKR